MSAGARTLLRWAWPVVGLAWCASFAARAAAIAGDPNQDSSDRDIGVLAARATATIALAAALAAAAPGRVAVLARLAIVGLALTRVGMLTSASEPGLTSYDVALLAGTAAVAIVRGPGRGRRVGRYNPL